MKKTLKPLLTASLLLASLAVLLAGPTLKPSQNLLNTQDWGFVPNKGQLADEHGNVLKDVKYYGQQGGVNLYCRPGKISFVFTKVQHENGNISEASGRPAGNKHESHENDKIVASRADMMLIGANPNTKIIATDEQAYYENYILPQTGKQGISNVHTFKTLSYQNIYPHIDLVLHSRAQGIKYEFVVHAGGKVSDIQMQWYGLASAQLMASGGISYSMRLDNAPVGMTESAPLSFTAQGKVASRFSKQGNKVSFKVGKYDHTQALTIDPVLEWGTFFGGDKIDEAKSKADSAGNVYLGGYTSSTSGIATSGAYQTSLNFGADIFIAKFNTKGARVWGTYFGGDQDDEAEGICLDKNGNIFVAGYSGSSNLATSGAYKTSIGGFHDVFIAKFTNAGSLSWATYYGGTEADYAHSIASDASGNIYITGETHSSSGIATSGSYQTKFGGIIDGYVAKFSNAGKLVWGSYYGGSDFDWGYAVCADRASNVFITGATQSTDIVHSGTVQKSYAKNEDAFLAKFNANGSLAWDTYYGDSATDGGNGLCTDKAGNVYMGGYSSSENMATSGAYQSKPGGAVDGLLAKFSASGSLIWATYFGGSDVDAGADLCISGDNKLYFAGRTGSENGIATKGADRTKYLGNYDGFVSQFDTAGALKWATYYGGPDQDDVTSVSSDAFGNIYISGNTLSSTGLSTFSAFQTKGSGNGIYDIYFAKFSRLVQNDAGLDSFLNPYRHGCVDKIPVSVFLKNHGTNTLTSVKISWSVNGTAQTDYNWSGSLATGRDTLVNLDTSLYASSKHYNLIAYTHSPNGVLDSVPANDTLKVNYVSNPLPNYSWTIKNNGGVYHFAVPDSVYDDHIRYQWILSDSYQTGAYSFYHRFPSQDLYQVRLFASNGYGCVNSLDTFINVRGSGILPGPKENVYHVNIYPNPFSDKTIIHFNNPQAAMVKVSVSDMLGKVLYTSANKQYTAGDNEIEINSAEAGLSTGSYFVSIIIGTETVVKKVVVIGR